jgi:hypothetical protein
MSRRSPLSNGAHFDKRRLPRGGVTSWDETTLARTTQARSLLTRRRAEQPRESVGLSDTGNSRKRASNLACPTLAIARRARRRKSLLRGNDIRKCPARCARSRARRDRASPESSCGEDVQYRCAKPSRPPRRRQTPHGSALATRAATSPQRMPLARGRRECPLAAAYFVTASFWTDRKREHERIRDHRRKRGAQRVWVA